LKPIEALWRLSRIFFQLRRLLHLVKNIDIYFLYAVSPMFPTVLDNVIISAGWLRIQMVARSGTWFAVFEKQVTFKGNM